ncbi:MAG: hypothetical protein AAFY15_00025 [Cyanobacteria bacterium J06648_11]
MQYTSLDDLRERYGTPESIKSPLLQDPAFLIPFDRHLEALCRLASIEFTKVQLAQRIPLFYRGDFWPKMLIAPRADFAARFFELAEDEYCIVFGAGHLELLLLVASVATYDASAVAGRLESGEPRALKGGQEVGIFALADQREALMAQHERWRARVCGEVFLSSIGRLVAMAASIMFLHELGHILFFHRRMGGAVSPAMRRAQEAQADLFSWRLMRGVEQMDASNRESWPDCPGLSWEQVRQIANGAKGYGPWHQEVRLATAVWLSQAAASPEKSSYYCTPAQRWYQFRVAGFELGKGDTLAFAAKLLAEVILLEAVSGVDGIVFGELESRSSCAEALREIRPEMARLAARQAALGQEMTFFSPELPGEFQYRGTGNEAGQ